MTTSLPIVPRRQQAMRGAIPLEHKPGGGSMRRTERTHAELLSTCSSSSRTTRGPLCLAVLDDVHVAHRLRGASLVGSLVGP